MATQLAVQGEIVKRPHSLASNIRASRILRSAALTGCTLAGLLACRADRKAIANTTSVSLNTADHGAAMNFPTDSLRAAQIAIRVSRDSGVTVPLGISSFQRDSAGYLIVTAPTSPRDVGGETLVRVHNDGRAEIVGRYQ